MTKEVTKINDMGPKRGSNSASPNNADNSHHDAEIISRKVAHKAIFSTLIL